MDTGNRILGLIMRHYNSVLEAIENDQYERCFLRLTQEDGSEFFDAEGWWHGLFMLGADRVNEPWDAVFKDRPKLVSPMVLLARSGLDLLNKSKD